MKSDEKELLKEVMFSSKCSSLDIICNADGGTFEFSGAVKTIIKLNS